MAFEFGNIEISQTEIDKRSEVIEPTLYDIHRKWSGKAHKLCFIAQKEHKVADYDWFVRGGIPREIMNEWRKNKLWGGGKNHQPIYWNWERNLTHKYNTMSRYLEFLKDKYGSTELA